MQPSGSANKPAAVNSYAAAVRRAAPAVVNIFTRKHPKPEKMLLEKTPLDAIFNKNNPPTVRYKAETNLGSGVIVSTDGHILTNHHVISDAKEIEVILDDGRYLNAELVGRDIETDLAVLKVSAQNLPVITFGDSEVLQVGDVVLAIGNPYGLGNTVTSGIVSGLERSRFRTNNFDSFIQTDAAINPGNSGGALVNTNGEMIGINTINLSDTGGSQGIGFAIPSVLAKKVMSLLITQGEVLRGWIGIEAKQVTSSMADQLSNESLLGSLLVISILSPGPAETAGMRPGDIITHINGHRIETPRQALELITQLQPGDEAVLTGYRGEQVMTFNVTVSKRPSMAGS